MSVLLTGSNMVFTPKIYNITVKVSDSVNYLSAVLAACNLTVAGTKITGAETLLTVSSSTIEIEAIMVSAISKARSVLVNETSLGSVKDVGSSVSTTIQVADGDTVNIVFKS